MYSYLQKFTAEVTSKIINGDLNEALKLLVNFVESIIKDVRSTGNVFGSEVLDNLCQQVGAKNLLYQQNFKQQQDDQQVVYIVTELSKTGGHTAVIEDLIKVQPHKKHLILITNILNEANREEIENRFASILVDIVWVVGDTLLEKLNWLQCQLILKQPSQIFLFNHCQDAVAVAAVQPRLVKQLIFYHHCDHQLCLGLYLTYAQHIDPHSTGFYNCNSLGVANTYYIPLIVEDSGDRPKETYFFVDGKLRTCSSGSAHKFEQYYVYSYAEEIPKILEITGGTHIHIGGLSPHTLEIINATLASKGINLERFIYIPWVKSLWKTMHSQKVDVYLSSFPLGGGRASVEVMGSGTPIIGHHNYSSRLLSGFDVIYPEAFFWKQPDELYIYLQNLTPETLLKQARNARKHYEIHHTQELLQQGLQKLSAKEEGLEPPPMREYWVDELQIYLDKSTSSVLKNFLQTLDKIHPLLDETRLELDRNKVSDFLYDITSLPIELERSESQFKQSQSQLQQSQVELQQTNDKIASMRTSKFWRLRSKWFQIKYFLGLSGEHREYIELGEHREYIELSENELSENNSFQKSLTVYKVDIKNKLESQRPRIAHIIANFMTGGSSRLVVDLIENLGHVYEQEVITSCIPNPPNYVGLNICEYSNSSSSENILAHLQSFRPRIIHIHFWGDSDTSWYEKMFSAIKKYECCVVENINTPVPPLTSRHIDKYVYVSDYVKENFGYSQPHHLTIYPGSNIELFCRRDEQSIPDDCIGMVYRLEKDKLSQNSIDVFIKVVQQRPQTKVLIIGGGTFLEIYRNAVNQAKVADNFTFTGYVAYEELPSLYEKMSVFVAPVRKESFGQVSPFAMNMGIPVVGYNVGGLMEIINSYDLLADRDDSNQLAKITIDLLNNREKRLRIGEDNRKRFLELFSLEAMIDSYRSLYKELLQDH